MAVHEERKRDGLGRLAAGTAAERMEAFRSMTRLGANGCIEWTGHIRSGYGLFWLNGRRQSAHRVAYEHQHGPIPGGLVIDHLCRNRRCVNTEHMEVVSQRENVLRGETIPRRNFEKKQCKHGHLLIGENVHVEKDGSRRCMECVRLRNQMLRNRRRGL